MQRTLEDPTNNLKSPKTLKNDERTQIQVHTRVSLRQVMYDTQVEGSTSHIYNTDTQIFSLKVAYG